MSTIVAGKVSHYESLAKQLDSINEDLNGAHVSEGHPLSDRIRSLLTQKKQMETVHNDMSNKYQALLLQTNMLTGIIKQHSSEIDRKSVV